MNVGKPTDRRFFLAVVTVLIVVKKEHLRKALPPKIDCKEHKLVGLAVSQDGSGQTNDCPSLEEEPVIIGTKFFCSATLHFYDQTRYAVKPDAAIVFGRVKPGSATFDLDQNVPEPRLSRTAICGLRRRKGKEKIYVRQIFEICIFDDENILQRNEVLYRIEYLFFEEILGYDKACLAALFLVVACKSGNEAGV